MIAVTIADDGLRFKVHEMIDNKITDVTDRFVIYPMTITLPDGRNVIGFHVGQPQAQPDPQLLTTSKDSIS